MIGIVIVSHSRELVAGIKALIEQMVSSPEAKEKIAYVGGLDDESSPIGTDPMQVMEAITSVAGEEGVLVLMDLGSALLSAETALDFIDPEVAKNVRLCAAPIVEGALAAAIQASLGADLESVAREAEGALAMKRSQLGLDDEEEAAGEQSATLKEEDGLSLELIITNENGLHARPAARFVGCAGKFQAEIQLEKAGKHANAKSINQVAGLAVKKGETIHVVATGSDAAEALAAIRLLHEDQFGEKDVQPLQPPAQTSPTAVNAGGQGESLEGVLSGIAVSAGIAIGEAFLLKSGPLVVKQEKSDSPEEELRRLDVALREAVTVTEQEKAAVGKSNPQQAEIFDFHRLLLQDEETLEATKKRIREDSNTAEAAWQSVTEELVERYRNIDDSYLRERAADVVDIQQKVLRGLIGGDLLPTELPGPVIVIAKELSPGDVVALPPETLGICMEEGGATSHAAILAAARGLPTLTAIHGLCAGVENGQLLILDGSTGQLHLHPDAATTAQYRERQLAAEQQVQRLQESAQLPAITRDDHSLRISANIGGPKDVAGALAGGAEGVGLFRTEFLFQESGGEPDEDSQCASYRAAVEALAGRPLIVRTLDIGGDKPLKGMSSLHEENPFLGQRGIRLTFAHPEIFKRQLRALLRASHYGDLKIMFPMIGSLGEFRQAKTMLQEAMEELQQEKIPCNAAIEVGLMIEVPSAVILADQLAAEADFFSIGTNDLSQYILAADRGNAGVAGLITPFHPAVLRAVDATVKAAHEANIHVGMCGAFAGMQEAAPLLVGLGLDELSMNAPGIAGQKEAIRALTQKDAQECATAALRCSSAEEVQQLLEDVQGGLQN